MKLFNDIQFDPDTTLMIDDNPHVLAQAKAFGIRHQLMVAQPDSGRQREATVDFPGIDDLSQLLPGISL